MSAFIAFLLLVFVFYGITSEKNFVFNSSGVAGHVLSSLLPQPFLDFPCLRFKVTFNADKYQPLEFHYLYVL